MCMINPIALRKVRVLEHTPLKNHSFSQFLFYRTKIISGMGEHLKIIEYPKGGVKVSLTNPLRGRVPSPDRESLTGVPPTGE